MPDLSLNFSVEARGTADYGDLVVADGDLRMTSDTSQGAALGTEPISQSVAQKMRTLLGEFFLDTSLGVPYYQELLGKKVPTKAFENALQAVVLGTPGVLALLSWDLKAEPSKRRLQLTFRAQTATGLIGWSGNLNPQGGI